MGDRKVDAGFGIMLELCELLKINVNELLSGEHITMEDYNAKSEKVILGLKSENEKYAKRLLRSEAYIVVVGVGCKSCHDNSWNYYCAEKWRE